MNKSKTLYEAANSMITAAKSSEDCEQRKQRLRKTTPSILYKLCFELSGLLDTSGMRISTRPDY